MLKAEKAINIISKSEFIVTC